MAQRPDGKAARAERVVFTRPAAERISKAVRTVELGRRDSQPLDFSGKLQSVKVIRVCEFTGSWSIDTAKTITHYGKTSTVSAQNVLFDLPDNGKVPCVIAKDGSAWHLVDVRHTVTEVITGVSLGTAGLTFQKVKIQVASLQTASPIIISTTTCA